MLFDHFDERGSCSDACPFSTVAEFNSTVPARNNDLNLQQRDISAQSCPVCCNFPNPEHGTGMKMPDGTVMVVCDLQRALKVRNDVLVKRLFKRLYQLCIAPETQWITMLRMSNQKLLAGLQCLCGKPTGQSQGPFSWNDLYVQRLPTLVYVVSSTRLD